uniref:Uncharacterized protein n=1 Tax=Arundo donax TaxID=35708 RepID=A0A0A9CWM6_ARUDO
MMLSVHTKRKLNARPKICSLCTRTCAMRRLKLKYWLSRVMMWQKPFQVLSQHAKSTSLLSVSLLRAIL